MIKNIFGGFCMALADSVPGVSGGTIAFILGFYDEFIGSLNDLISGTMEDRKKALVFLIKLGIGWAAGMIFAVLILANLFTAHIYQVSSLFLGFVLFSIPVVIREEKECIVGKYQNVFFFFLGAALVGTITYLNSGTGAGSSMDLAHLTVGSGIYLFFAAMVAITAMVLPGISGSTLLLIFGIYVPVMTGVKEFLHLNLSVLPGVLVFGLGVITGIILIIKLVKAALSNFRSQTLYTILGLMAGSLYAIIMGPATLEEPKEIMNLSNFSLVFFALGGLVILGLQLLKKDSTEEKAVR